MKIETAVICGDGVGPEMMGAALSALKAVCKKYHHEPVMYPVCACSEALEQGKELAVKKIKTIERDKRTIKTGRASEQVV